MISRDVRFNDPCGRITCETGWIRAREHSLWLADAELWFVWKGRGWMRTLDREYTVLPGFCALMRPGGIYDAGHDDANPLGIAYIHFQFTGAPAGIPELLSTWPEFYDLRDIAYWDALTRRIVELYARQPATAALLLRGALADLLETPHHPGSMAEKPPLDRHRKRISEIVSRLSLEMEKLPAVETLAREAGLSAGHFTRTFKAVTGQSPKDFLLRTRITRAQYYLRETDLTISEIADRLGYADVFFFSRQFKQKTGTPPLRYRLGGAFPGPPPQAPESIGIDNHP